jgi:hypothetical protein
MSMDLKAEILREHSKLHAESLADWVGADRKRFRKLMELFLRGDHRVAQRSAWVVNICAESHPELIRPYLQQMIARMQQPGVHDAVRRNVVRILQFVEVPERLLGVVATACFEYLSSPAQPIAVKAFSMVVLGNIARKEPDMKRELQLVIEQQAPYASAGFRSCARKVLSRLRAS